MTQITRYIRRHHIALLALFVALGGTSYAAVKLPAGSVGTSQLQQDAVTAKKIRAGAVSSPKLRNGAVTARALRNGSVTTEKLRNDSVTSAKVVDGSLLAVDFAPGQLPQGPPGPPGPADGPAGGALTGSYPNPGIADGAVGPDQIGEIPAVRLIRDQSNPVVPVPGTAASTVLAWPAPTGDRPFDIGGFFILENNPVGQCVGQGPDTCIVFPRSGTYAVSAGVRWADPALGTPAADNGDGYRSLRIHGQGGRQSGTTVTPAVEGTPTIQSVTTIDRYAAGQAAFLSVAQNSGVSVNVAGTQQQVYFAAVWLGP